MAARPARRGTRHHVPGLARCGRRLPGAGNLGGAAHPDPRGRSGTAPGKDDGHSHKGFEASPVVTIGPRRYLAPFRTVATDACSTPLYPRTGGDEHDRGLSRRRIWRGHALGRGQNRPFEKFIC